MNIHKFLFFLLKELTQHSLKQASEVLWYWNLFLRKN